MEKDDIIIKLTEEVEFLKRRVKTLDETRNFVDEQLIKYKKRHRIGKLENKIEELENRIENLESKWDHTIPDLDRRIDSINSSIRNNNIMYVPRKSECGNCYSFEKIAI